MYCSSELLPSNFRPNACLSGPCTNLMRQAKWKRPQQGWRRGESACLSSMWPSFESRTRGPCGASLLLVLFLAPRVFPEFSCFLPSTKNQHFPNSNSIRKQWTNGHLVDVPLLISIFLFTSIQLHFVVERTCAVFSNHIVWISECLPEQPMHQ